MRQLEALSSWLPLYFSSPICVFAWRRRAKFNYNQRWLEITRVCCCLPSTSFPHLGCFSLFFGWKTAVKSFWRKQFNLFPIWIPQETLGIYPRKVCYNKDLVRHIYHQILFPAANSFPAWTNSESPSEVLQVWAYPRKVCNILDLVRHGITHIVLPTLFPAANSFPELILSHYGRYLKFDPKVRGTGLSLIRRQVICASLLSKVYPIHFETDYSVCILEEWLSHVFWYMPWIVTGRSIEVLSSVRLFE